MSTMFFELNYFCCVYKLFYHPLSDQGAEKHDGAGTSGITDQEKELSSSALQAFLVRRSQTHTSHLPHMS